MPNQRALLAAAELIATLGQTVGITEIRVRPSAIEQLWRLRGHELVRTTYKRDHESGDPPNSLRIAGILIIADDQADENDRLRGDLQRTIHTVKGQARILGEQRKALQNKE